MRKIPDSVTDPTQIAKLNAISIQMENKMKQVNALRDSIKKKDLSADQLQALKNVSAEIDALDQQWKALL